MKTILSICDLTGNMVLPWAEAGYDCICVDLQENTEPKHKNITHVQADILDYLPPLAEYYACFCFPSCRDLSVSGARHFKTKGLSALVSALALVDRCRKIAKWTKSRWFIENPRSTISTYWRKPDYTFNPADYTGFCLGDNYSKYTCLWCSESFVMPEPNRAKGLGEPDDRIHKAPPGPNRSNFRSATPMGFARAVYEANK